MHTELGRDVLVDLSEELLEFRCSMTTAALADHLAIGTSTPRRALSSRFGRRCAFDSPDDRGASAA